MTTSRHRRSNGCHSEQIGVIHPFPGGVTIHYACVWPPYDWQGAAVYQVFAQPGPASLMMPDTMPGERIQAEIDRLLDQISDSLAERDWRSALESAEAALGLDPQNEDARVLAEAAQDNATKKPPNSRTRPLPSRRNWA